MRPGQIRPGNARVLEKQALVDCGFNEAGANSPRKSLNCPGPVTGVEEASMRPGQIRPGNAAFLLDNGLDVRRASMRPGQIRPGNRHVVQGQGGGCLASMRPGQIRPGNFTSWPWMAWFAVLQ